MELIKKDIERSLKRVLALMQPNEFMIRSGGHFLDRKTVKVKKKSKEYSFELEPLPFIDTKAFLFSPSTQSELFNEDLSLFFQGEKLFLNKIGYDEYQNQVGSGSLSGFTTTSNKVSFNNRYLRWVIPVGKDNKAPDLTDFEAKGYITPQKLMALLVYCRVADEDFQIYTHKLQENKFLIIDCLNKTNLEVFEQKCYCILLALGFLTGQLTLNEVYILSFEDKAMQVPLNIKYRSSGPSISTNIPVFKSYTYTLSENSKVPAKNEKIGAKKNEKKYPFLFPETVFSKLTTLFFNYDELERVAMLLIRANSTNLELALPGYHIAIEAIKEYFKKHVFIRKQDINPIKNKKIAAQLRKKMLEVAKEVKKESELNDAEFDLKTIEAKINDINKFTNRAALSKPFEHFGYKLSAEEYEILEKRNQYLHGRFHGNVSSPERLKESIHLEARLNFLIAYLLLKLAGFSGKIINQAKNWSDITGKALNEDELIDIL